MGSCRDENGRPDRGRSCSRSFSRTRSAFSNAWAGPVRLARRLVSSSLLVSTCGLPNPDHGPTKREHWLGSMLCLELLLQTLNQFIPLRIIDLILSPV